MLKKRIHFFSTVSGFTLVELLVVIAIIGILVALLLPAIQAARAAARRAQCLNKFKQVGIGIQNYESAVGEYPIGWKHAEFECGLDFFYEGWGWGAFILPYIEQQAIYDNIIITPDGGFPRFKDRQNSGNDKIAAIIDLYLCPDDSQRNRVEITNLIFNNNNEDVARSNMAGIADPEDFSCATRLGTTDRYPDPEARGILRGWKATKIAEVTDGLSNTILVGEVTGQEEEGIYAFWWATASITDTRHGINGAGSVPGGGPGAWRGRHSGLSSYHTGGCHVAIADGSSRFILEDTDQIVLERMVMRADGEIIDEGL